MKYRIIILLALLRSFTAHAQWPIFDRVSTFGGNQQDVCNTIATDSYGNVYSFGTFRDVVDFDPGPGVYSLMSSSAFFMDIFIMKTDVNGNLIWVKQLGSTTNEFAYDIAVNDSGDLFLLGDFTATIDFDPGPGVYFVSTGYSGTPFLLKLDSGGNFEWVKTFPGSNGSGSPYSIAFDNQGNLFLTGIFQYTMDFDPGPGVETRISVGLMDIFIVKLDSIGNFIWLKTFGSPLSSCYGNEIVVDPAGDIYVSGSYQNTVDFDPGNAQFNLTSNGSSDIFILKLDNNGNFIRAQSFGGISGDGTHDLSVDPNGGLFVAGSFGGTIDFDPGPAVYNLTASSNFFDSFVLKLDSAGNFIWANSIGGIGYDAIMEMVRDSNSNIYLTGYYEDIVDFNPGSGTYFLSSADSLDAFILKLNSNGSFDWALSLGGTGIDKANSLLLDKDNNLYVGGIYQGTGDYDPGPGVASITSAGDYDYFLLKLTSTTVGLNTTEGFSNGELVYPNPATSVVTIRSKEDIANICVRDASGRKIMDLKPDKNDLSIDIDKLIPGVYFLEIMGHAGNKVMKKLVKQ